MAFNLDRYVENLCWAAYQKAQLDKSLEFNDLLQQARLALLRAERSYSGTRGSWHTFAVTCVRNSLVDLLRRNLRLSGDRLDDHRELVTPENYAYLRNARLFLDDVELSNEARMVLRAVFRSRLMPSLSLRSLQRSLNMPARRFRRAVAELRKKYGRYSFPATYNMAR